MKYLIPFLCLLLNCNHIQDSENTITSEIKFSEKSDSNKAEDQQLVNDSSWIVAFRTLREDIYQKRPEKFVEFPFIDEHKSIWYLIESLGNENKYNKSSISIQEFNKYYGEIFDKEFISLLLKVKSNDLNKAKEFTIDKHYGDTATYSLNVNYDVLERKISLYLNYKGRIELEQDEFENAEYMEGFVFYLVGDRFYLKEIVLAG